MVDFLIRVDATKDMGVGHVMRCLALAQQCQEQQMNIVFVCTNLVDMCEKRILGNHFQIQQLKSVAGSEEEAQETLSLARKLGAKAILFDGYHFSNSYFDYFKNTNLSLWMIDDFFLAPSFFNMVINFQAWSKDKPYAPTCKQFLGFEYYLLRKEFWPYIPPRSATSQKNSILIMMGGTDPNQQTERVLAIIDKLNLPLDVSLIMGTKVAHIEEYIQNMKSTFKIVKHINPDNIPELMMQALFAVTAGGGTCWELAFMQVPSLVIVQAANQEMVADQMQKLGVGLNLGLYDQLSDQALESRLSDIVTSSITRHNMRSACAKLNIGKNTNEIVHFIKEQCGTR